MQPGATEKEETADALGGVAAASAVGAVFIVCRMGAAELLPGQVARIWLLCLVIYCGPVLLRRSGRPPAPNAWTASWPWRTLVWLAGVTLLGEASGRLGLPPLWPLLLIPAGLICRRLIKARDGVREHAAAAALGVLFGVWAAAAVWSSYYFDPLFAETLPAGSPYIDTDPLYHSALSQMIQTYGAASTGLDGLPASHYHTGSHYWFAQLGNFLGLPSLEVYRLVYHMFCLPLLVLVLLGLAREIRGLRGDGAPGSTVVRWLIVLSGMAGILPIQVLEQMYSFNSLPLSESYVISILAAALFAAAAAAFARAGAKTGRGWGGFLFLFLLMPVMIFAIGTAKISLGVFSAVTFVYLVVRVPELRSLPWGISALLSLGALLATYRLIGGGPFPAVFYPFYYYISLFFKPGKEWLFPIFTAAFLVIHYLWTAIYFVLRLGCCPEPGPGRSLRRALQTGAYLDLEILTLLAAAGVAPGLFLAFPIGAEVYFSGVQHYAAIVFAAAAVPLLLQAAQRPPARRVLIVLFAGAALMFLINTGVQARRLALKETALREKLETAREAAAQHENEPAGAVQRGRFEVIRQLHDLSRLPREVKRETAVFIPKSNKLFWTFPVLFCDSIPFIVPAVSGIAMIRGMDPAHCQYYWRDYDTYDLAGIAAAEEQEDAESLSAVCRSAAAAGFSRVIILLQEGDSRIKRVGAGCPLKSR